MGFWNSFFRETGKNSGKWLSNKVFGSSWSTPYSIEHKYATAANQRRKKIEENGFGLDEIEFNSVDQELIKLGISKEDRNSSFEFEGTTSQEIEIVLDRLFLELKSTKSNLGMNPDQAKFKIKTGIHKLKTLEKHEIATFYENELNTFLKKEKSAGCVGIIIGIICLIGLVIIAFGKF
jgi:hypothetical protein